MVRSAELDDLYAIAVPTSSAISPDGSRVAYAVKRAERTTDSEPSTLWIAPTDGLSPARRLTDGETDYAPQFSPDGLRVAFLRLVDSLPQLHEVAIGSGRVRTLTSSDRLPKGAGLPRYSPDGESIAFSARVDPAGPDAPADAPLVSDLLDDKADGRGRVGRVRRQLFVLDLHDLGIRRLTEGVGDVGTPSWSPDGSMLAFSAASEPDSDLTLVRTAQYLRIDSSGSPVPLRASASIAGPLVWTAAGDALVAVVSGKYHVGPQTLMLRTLDPDEPGIILTADLDRNVMPGESAGSAGSLALTADGTGIVFCLRDRGWTHLHRIGIDGGESTPLVAEENQVITGLSVASEAPLASFVLTTAGSFGEIAIADLDSGEVRVISRLTEESLPDVELLTPEQRTFEISDGVAVHGWLLRSTGTAAGPLLLDIHGGPHNAWSGTATTRNLHHQLLAQRGWSILMLNPRGSDGYGQEFLESVIGGWGSADMADFLEPIDQLVAEGIADPRRLAVTGYSYGGFSVCHLTSHDDRFAAAIAGGLICDFASMLGGSDLGLFFIEDQYLAHPVNDLERLLELSPVSRVGQVSTPTLVLHGEADQRCPVNQGERWFASLRTLRVPTRLVVYPGESHLFLNDGRPSHRLDYTTRLVDWLDRYVPDASDAG
jgi:dipeptidyl aminopeptidase/acylaminoacyl peptidase